MKIIRKGRIGTDAISLSQVYKPENSCWCLGVSKQIFLVLGLSIGLLSDIYPVFGLDLNPEEIRGEETKSPVNILQNRYFLKALRPELGVSAGSFVNDAYTETVLWGYRGAIFLNEWLGIEVQSITTKVSESDDRKALNQLQYQKIGTNEIVSPDPDVNPIYGSKDVCAIIAPFYGKLNFLDSVIIYSDLYLTAGVSKVDTEQGVMDSISWGLGQRFYWKKSISFRIEVKDRTYNEERSGEEYTRHAYSVDLGMSYFLL